MESIDQKSWFDQLNAPRVDDSSRHYCVLVADLVGLELDAAQQPKVGEFKSHVEARGAEFLVPEDDSSNSKQAGPGIVFEYRPELSRAEDILKLATVGQYDAVIAAATVIPEAASFPEGGVRIGAGTANMASSSWVSGKAPLMNTPSFNSRATAQMVFKALLRTQPNLPLERLDQRVEENSFDTGEHLRDFPTRKLEGQRIAVLGFGNIGREVALLGRAFGMQVAVFARPRLQRWIESEGFEFCLSVEEAALQAQVLSVHLGLGAQNTESAEGAEEYANAGIVDASVFSVLAANATLINFDRGELVNVEDLGRALTDGNVAHATIDADIFLPHSKAAAASPSGPLGAYRELRARHPERVLLLPHAAADTDHPSRVAGAIQAADQIIAAIRYRCIANGVGVIPDGYKNIGEKRIAGVGGVSSAAVSALVVQPGEISAMRAQLAELDNWLESLEAPSEGGSKAARQSAKEAVMALNQLATTARKRGLFGPGTEL